MNTGEFEECIDNTGPITHTDNISSATSKNKITIKDTIDIFYPKDFNPDLLIKIIDAVTSIV